MSRTVRAFAALALMVLLAGPVAAATPYSFGASLWSSAWQWLVELVLPDGPTGAEEPPPSGPNEDAGGGLDPNGVKVFSVTGEPKAEAGPAVR